MFKPLKRLLLSDRGSISAAEGLALAVLAVAAIMAVRTVLFAPEKQRGKSITIEEKWPGLPPREPLAPFHPLKD